MLCFASSLLCRADTRNSSTVSRWQTLVASPLQPLWLRLVVMTGWFDFYFAFLYCNVKLFLILCVVISCVIVFTQMTFRHVVSYEKDKRFQNNSLQSKVFPEHAMKAWDRNSSVGIATRYRLGGPAIKFRLGRDFPHPSRPALGAYRASYSTGGGCLSRG